MVIGAFPAAKLGVLAIKQVSKPIANIIKSKAKEHPLFRNYVCMPPAQLYNWVEVKTKMWALNLGKPVNVPPLTEAMAVELGANLLGEFIIFAIGAGLLIFEYARQTSNEAKKQENAALEKAELTNNLAEMTFRLERQDAQLRELTRVLADIESRSIFRWTKERLGEYQTFNPDNPNQSSHTTNQAKSSYNPEGGLVMRALYFLETQVLTNIPPSAYKPQIAYEEPAIIMTPATFAENDNIRSISTPANQTPSKTIMLLKMNPPTPPAESKIPSALPPPPPDKKDSNSTSEVVKPVPTTSKSPVKAA